MEEYPKPLLWSEESTLKEIFKTFRRFAEVTGEMPLVNKLTFLLGSYSEEKIDLWNISPKDELNALKHSLNNLKGVSCYLLEDFQGFLDKDLINKFYIISKISDIILTVIECNNKVFIVGIGHILELGIIVARREFAEKTFILVRHGTKLTSMLSEGVFKTHYMGRKTFFFKNINELINLAINIVSSLNKNAKW